MLFCTTDRILLLFVLVIWYKILHSLGCFLSKSMKSNEISFLRDYKNKVEVLFKFKFKYCKKTFKLRGHEITYIH